MKTIKKLNESKKRNFDEQFFVFDTETYGLNPQKDKLAFGVIYGKDFLKILRTPKEFQEEFKHPRYNNKKIFAHNAEYDTSSIFGNVIANIDNSAIFNGKFISLKYHKTSFCDSSNIYPTSAEKIGKMLGFPKGKTPDKFINPEKYTKQEKRINTEDIEYCIQDCKIIFKALLQMFERVGGIRITIASTAMYYFRKRYLKSDILYSPLNDLFFESYYGGRTEAFKIGETSSKCYDINSLYPSEMIKMKFPDYKNLKYDEYINTNKFKNLIKFKEGFAKVRVLHSESYFGLLPYKCPKTKKLLFPVGEFTTFVNFNELRFAIKTGKVKILKVFYACYSNPIETPFSEYVKDLYTERKNSDSELMKTILKLLLNSLYGKFGMREKFTTTYYRKIPNKLIANLKSKNKFYKVQTFSTKRNDCYLITENYQTKSTFFSIPSIASYITSSARIKLLDGLLKNENKKVVYCDTDSIFLEDYENINLPLSNELGDWKLEDKHITEIRGLKNYSYIENGKHHHAIKGVPRGAKEIGKFKFESKKYIKTKEAIRRNKKTGEQKIVVKTITNKYDKRIVLENGNTKPIKI